MNSLAYLDDAWKENQKLSASLDELMKELDLLQNQEKASLAKTKKLEERIEEAMKALKSSEEEHFDSKKAVVRSLIKNRVQKIEIEELEEKVRKQKEIASLYREIFHLKKEWDQLKNEIVTFQRGWAFKESMVMLTPPYWIFCFHESNQNCFMECSLIRNPTTQEIEILPSLICMSTPFVKAFVLRYDVLGIEENNEKQKELFSRIDSLVRKISFRQKLLQELDPSFSPISLPTLPKKKTLLSGLYGRSGDTPHRPLFDFFSSVLQPLLPPP